MAEERDKPKGIAAFVVHRATRVSSQSKALFWGLVLGQGAFSASNDAIPEGIALGSLDNQIADPIGDSL